MLSIWHSSFVWLNTQVQVAADGGGTAVSREGGEEGWQMIVELRQHTSGHPEPSGKLTTSSQLNTIPSGTQTGPSYTCCAQLANTFLLHRRFKLLQSHTYLTSLS